MGDQMDDKNWDDDWPDDYTDDYYGGFDNYTPTTRDPGSIFIIATSVYIVFSYLAMWPLVYYGRKWKKYRKARKRDKFKKSSWKLMKKLQRKEGKVGSPISVDDTVSTLDDSLLDSAEEPIGGTRLFFGSVDPGPGSLEKSGNTELYPSSDPDSLKESKYGISSVLGKFKSKFNGKSSITSEENNDGGGLEMAPNLTNYLEEYWADLPRNIMAAASVLGYTKELWDGDKPPPTDDKGWNDLSEEEQYAATLIGYTQATWDAVSDSDSSESSSDSDSGSETGFSPITIESNTSSPISNSDNIIYSDGISPIRNSDHIINSDSNVVENSHQEDPFYTTLFDAVDEVLDEDYFADDDGDEFPNESIYHDDEEGNRVLICLPEPSWYKQVPMLSKKRRKQENVKDMFDHEEEDEVPENAFKVYYEENTQDVDEDENDPFLEKNANNTPQITFEASDIAEEITRGINTWNRVIYFDKESRKLLKIALPSTISTVADTILDAIATAMISVEIGPEALTAYYMISLFIGITDIFIGGVESAESTLTAQAIGMGNHFLAGQYFQLSTTLYIIVAIPTYGMWVLISEWCLIKLDMGEVISQIGGAYVRIGVVSYFINGLAGAFSTLLWSAEYGTLMTVIDTTFHVLYIVALWILFNVYGLRDMVSVAWVGVLFGVIYGVFMFLYVYYKGLLDPYWKGMFRNFALKNNKLVCGVLKMAVPLALGDVMSYGEWEIFTFFSTTMGRAEVAAWSLGGAIWDIFEDMPSGFGYAAELRVAFHLGNGNPGMAKITAYKSLLYAFSWISFVTVLFTCFSSSIVRYFTHDDTLIEMINKLVIFISIGNVVCCIGSEAYYILSAQGRPKIPTW
eukprot:CAMPEP_0194269176 /NCGR_PEP_ID=MMETSP0169-20130528/3367_1 /TAXON_ID=218684 /ORGANISM="Corethron pennatum, Strain L29A3" /LENGTH=854 /DNA_ID=CAMNT_0039010715 /DNA_START=20 /DNA_END=2581 /DNA_ORIENTATION=+